MNILIISNVYYPVINPRALRWATIAAKWASQGHTVDVLASWRPGFPDHEQHKGVSIHRTGKSTFQSIRIKLLSMSEKRSGAGESGRQSAIQSPGAVALRAIKKISEITWKKIHWPDCECMWYPSAVRKARNLVRERSYDVLVSVSTPFTSHVVGRRVKKMIPSVPWVVDIGDPFSYHTVEHQNNYRLYNRLNFSTEENVFSHATGIAVTSEETREQYIRHFPDFDDKINVIPPLISFTNDFRENRKPYFSGGNGTRLLFVGNFYRPVRRPTFLFDAFRQLLDSGLNGKIELHIIGSVKNVMDFITPYNDLIEAGDVVLHGLMEHSRALDALMDADVLVNLGNDTSYQVPSKIVDYMATGKPIINLASICDDSSSRVLAEYPLSVTLTGEHCTKDSPEFLKAVSFLENIPRSLDEHTVDDIIRPYRIESISKQYLSLIT
ncbi:glycosyltransferase [Candidatus Latescibacterota bacterium]